MVIPTRPKVSLLSMAYDPALETAVASSCDRSHHISCLAQALAQEGWHVDLFTRQSRSDSLTTEWLAPHCRVIRVPSCADLPSNQQAAETARCIQTFQIKDGLISPLFHSLDEHSAQVGAYFKQHQGWRWLHTRWPETGELVQDFEDSSHIPLPDQCFLIRPQGIWIDPSLTDEVSQMRYQRTIASHKLKHVTWEQVATYLSQCYRQHLAAHVGAVGLNIPLVACLPLPVSGKEVAEGKRSVRPLEQQYAVPQYSYSA
ncbi:MAG: hypothetical protein NZ772_11140 [Cyanobacteria bacterium]|nr:hypothetical protein [Cyanobacteriota bacterium]MDW8201999.1 hypothetical protein [Cyanobacteriota bacterium SKYGB_h_bin112]